MTDLKAELKRYIREDHMEGKHEGVHLLTCSQCHPYPIRTLHQDRPNRKHFDQAYIKAKDYLGAELRKDEVRKGAHLWEYLEFSISYMPEEALRFVALSIVRLMEDQ